jgi:hypothetical protein
MAGPCLSRPAGVWPLNLGVSYPAVKSVPRLSLVDPYGTVGSAATNVGSAPVSRRAASKCLIAVSRLRPYVDGATIFTELRNCVDSCMA